MYARERPVNGLARRLLIRTREGVAMFLTDVTNSNAVAMLEKTLAFTEARNKMLAANIANATTPEHRTKQLDTASFQAALRDAAERRGAPNEPFQIAEHEQFEADEQGYLKVRPTDEPAENLLFHDGTNARIERQMAQLAENTLMNRVATDLLRDQFQRISSAIRGRVG